VSALQQMMLAGKSLITVSGTLSGSGSLTIPSGATSISLVGVGGSGTHVYNGGRAYIAPTYAFDNFVWYNNDEGNHFSAGMTTMLSVNVPPPSSLQITYYVGGLGPTATSTFNQTNYSPMVILSYTSADGLYVIVSQHYVMTSAGQSYIAPYYTDGTGVATTATANGVTDTWAAGYGTATGSSSTQVLSLSGAGQTMSYVVGSGGSLSYTYAY
jgi:hypothetical protein